MNSMLNVYYTFPQISYESYLASACIAHNRLSSDLGSKFLLIEQQHWTEAKKLGFLVCVEL